MMHEVIMQLDCGVPVALVSEHRKRDIARVLTTWRYRGRWWRNEIVRDYFMLELHDGAIVDAFCENECWFTTKRV